jgi:outer membrane protein OmpA-like peptidoglycan-associated protein
MRNTVLGALAAGWLLNPSVGYSDPIDVVLVPARGDAEAEIGSQRLYTALSEDLKRSLALQGIALLNLNDLGLASDPLPTLNTSAFSEFSMQQLAGKDYAISLVLTASVERTSVSRSVKLRAEGAVVDVSTGDVLTTYSVDAPEGIMLPLSEADCNATCAELELADAKTGLSRELSFVLTQKMYFLQEDGVIPQVSDPVAIADRLKPMGERPTSTEVVVGAGNTYTIDAARALDIEVYFDPNSDQLTDLARKQLAALGEALQDDDLSTAQYLIIGHTDATGASEYNLTLSVRRAARVREYLIETYAVAPNRLLSVGLGETQLKEPSKPNWGVNRRVEVALLVDGPTRTPEATALTEYTIKFNMFERDDALRVARELEQALHTAAALELSNTTQRIYVLKSDKATEAVEQALLRALEGAGFTADRVRLTVTREEIVLDKL